MTEYCLFRLYGPMASWGDIAVGEERHTWDHPSRSGIFGMIAAALGIKRRDEEAHRELASSYGFAVMVNSAGAPVIDYHTVQTVPQSVISRAKHFRTRRDELSIPPHRLQTIVSTRDYLCDMVSTVCIWPRVRRPPHSPDEIAAALREPVFELYLGRKSCPL
ncbi:MAG: type I-E CRISPR-associated protein Cas5/CasD, partial [Methanoculleaceae archaeon]